MPPSAAAAKPSAPAPPAAKHAAPKPQATSNPGGFSTHVPCLPNTFPVPDGPEPAHTSAPWGAGLKSLFIIILVLAAIGAWRQWRGNSALASWQNNWEKSVDEAYAQKKPILVLFSADWCPSCRELESKTLYGKDLTAKLLEEFVLTKIDLTDRGGPGSAVAREFGIKVIPTMVIVRPDGSRSEFLTGFVSADQLEAWAASRKTKKSH